MLLSCLLRNTTLRLGIINQDRKVNIESAHDEIIKRVFIDCFILMQQQSD
jgi:hypothetical protein